MQKAIRSNNGLLPLLVLSALLFLPMPGRAAAVAETMSRRTFEAKVEFYKVSYPAFDYQQAKTDAQEKYPCYKPGDQVTVFDGVRTVSGAFRECRQGRVFIDNEVVLLQNIIAADRYLYDSALAENLRRIYVEKKFHQYSRKRWDDIADYRRSLERQYRIIDDGGERMGTKKNPAPAGGAVVADTPLSGKVKMPVFGVVKNEILLSSGIVRAGEVIRDVRPVGFDRYSFTAADGRSLSADARNIVMVEGIHDPRDALLLSQAALALLVRNRIDEALFYTRLAANANPNQKRSELLSAMVLAVNRTASALKQGNAAIGGIDGELEQQLKLLGRNQAAIHDDFAVKAGTRDRSPEIAQQIFVLREKKKALQVELKKALEALLREGGQLASRAGEDGDFIAACLLLDWFERNYRPLTERAKVWWEEEDRQRVNVFFRQQQESLALTYSRLISRSFQDRWFHFLDRYVDVFGEQPGLWEKLDVAPVYPAMLAAAQASTGDAVKYSEAIYSGDFDTVLVLGLKLLVLLPQGEMAENCNRNLELAWRKIDKDITQLQELYRKKSLLQFVLGCRRLTPLPLVLKPSAATAERAMVEAGQDLKEAAAAAAEHDLDRVRELLRHSVAIWPDNPAVEKFQREFGSANREILADGAAVTLYMSQGRFRDAMEKCDLMYKAYPEFRLYVTNLRAGIRRGMEQASRELAEAERYLQAGRYQEAQTIFEKYNCTEGIEKVNLGMFKQGNASASGKKR